MDDVLMNYRFQTKLYIHILIMCNHDLKNLKNILINSLIFRELITDTYTIENYFNSKQKYNILHKININSHYKFINYKIR